ncbi:hypothetical protein ACFOQM_22545 [Paenibacillus sp. GCM10012307]|uniref:Uncharacterized protein n=1 Tax=Paenibacillus roseus TaxID=2798579 RepID=A0A934JBY5_9BACL|nr:hypothetical protein [Paenibacillus roseus]MBJ6364010.1 hypothetical protein [Paenibacillus roseus]
MIMFYVLFAIIVLGIVSVDVHLRAIRKSNEEIVELLRAQSKSRESH